MKDKNFYLVEFRDIDSLKLLVYNIFVEFRKMVCAWKYVLLVIEK